MEISKASVSEFDFIFSEIEKSFVPEERRDYKDAHELFSKGKYDIITFNHNGDNVGFITIWNFSDFTFAEHFVIYEEYRNNGYGAMALRALQSQYPKIVLEAEPPITPIAKRRLNFYKRNRFLQNGKKYMQPAYRDGGEEVELVIMSYPDLLTDFDRTVSLIKDGVYEKK